MLLFGFLFQRYPLAVEGASFGRPGYLDFLTPGICVLAILFGASQSGQVSLRELEDGDWRRRLDALPNPAPLLGGKILGDVALLILQSGAVLLLGVALGARLRFAPLPLLGALLALALLAAALCCLSRAVALLAHTRDALTTYAALVNLPLFFTSTALVPQRDLPRWLAAIARSNPVTLATEAWRRALLYGQAPDLLRQLLPLALLAAFCFALALHLLRDEPGRADLPEEEPAPGGATLAVLDDSRNAP
jgi:ABC-2 type transport system permease protein